MRDGDDNDIQNLIGLADNLLSKMLAEETVTEHDEVIFSKFKKMVGAHALYAQLLSVGIIIQLAKSIPLQLSTIEGISATIEENEAEMTMDQRLKAISTYSSNIRGMSDMLNTLNATKDASGTIVASLKELVGSSAGAAPTEEGDIVSKLSELDPRERNMLLRAAFTVLKDAGKEN